LNPRGSTAREGGCWSSQGREPLAVLAINAVDRLLDSIRHHQKKAPP
jgi:hypothetical protein